MARSPVEITQESAAWLAKQRLEQMLPTLSAVKAFVVKQSIKDGGTIDEIAKILYELGLKITIDNNNEEHKQWVADGVVELDK